MVMFPEDDMFLWKTQAIDTPSRSLTRSRAVLSAVTRSL